MNDSSCLSAACSSDSDSSLTSTYVGRKPTFKGKFGVCEHMHRRRSLALLRLSRIFLCIRSFLKLTFFSFCIGTGMIISRHSDRQEKISGLTDVEFLNLMESYMTLRCICYLT